MNEGPVANNRSSYTRAKLIDDQSIASLTPEIVKPPIRIENRIAMVFKNASVKLVRARTARNLNLSGSPSHLCIHGRCDDPDLLYSVHRGKENGAHTAVDQLIRHGDAVACDIHGSHTGTRKIVSV